MTSATRRLPRSARRARLFHSGVYLLTLPLLLTGWWLLLGGEGHPSPLARLFGSPDILIHRRLGWALAAVGLLPLLLGRRGLVGFARETLRLDRGDARWWARLPSAAFSGRFARHEGHFDPGQRVANVVLVLGLVAVTASGTGLTLLHGGPMFARLHQIHRWSTFAITPVIAGHLLVVSGLLPGYRGVWRAMHLGGRVSGATARRLWPAWTERAEVEERLRRSGVSRRPGRAVRGPSRRPAGT